MLAASEVRSVCCFLLLGGGLGGSTSFVAKEPEVLHAEPRDQLGSDGISVQYGRLGGESLFFHSVRVVQERSKGQ